MSTFSAGLSGRARTGGTLSEGRGVTTPRTQHTCRSTPMISLVRRGGKLPLTTFALAFAIWIFSNSSAMAQRGGHGGGGFGGIGHVGGMGPRGGFRHHGFGGLGG